MEIIRLLLFVAVAPVIVILTNIYDMDAREPEPKGFILSLLLSGILSSFLALILEFVGESYLNFYLPQNTLLKYGMEYFLVVGVSEELSKFIFLKNKSWHSEEFNYVFDGLIYGVTISLGFALIENINYVFSYGLITGIVRAFMSIPGHASFGVMMGCWYGLSKKEAMERNTVRAFLCQVLSILIPVIMHGTYDLLLTIGTELASGLSIVMLILCYIILINLPKSIIKQDEHIRNTRY